MIALDHANAAERFGQASGHLSIDLRAFAEDGPDGLERLLQDDGEDQKDDEGEQRHLRTDVQQPGKREDSGQNAADKVDDAGADEVAHALDVAHDARDEGTGAVLVVERNRKATDMLLHLHAQIGDEPLARFGEQLRERIRGNPLQQGCPQDAADDLRQQGDLVLPHHLVNEWLKERR